MTSSPSSRRRPEIVMCTWLRAVLVRPVGPYRVDEPVDRNGLVGTQQKQREGDLLPGGGDLDRLSRDCHLNRAKQPELH